MSAVADVVIGCIVPSSIAVWVFEADPCWADGPGESESFMTIASFFLAAMRIGKRMRRRVSSSEIASADRRAKRANEKPYSMIHQESALRASTPRAHPTCLVDSNTTQ